MTFNQFMEEMHGLTLVHWDAARGLACFWTGGTAFLEFNVTDKGVEQGSAWSVSQRLVTPRDAMDASQDHYSLVPN